MQKNKIDYQELLRQESLFLKTFGQKIKKQRILKDWSQEDLALESNLDRSYVGGIERGERNITLLKAKQIADALGIELKELL